MQQFIDFLPIAVFAGVYFVTDDIYLATMVLMVATVLQVALTWLLKRKVGGQLWLVLGISLVFGGLTLALHDKQFLFWKPTIINWLFAGMIGGGLLLKRNPLRSLLGGQLQLPDHAWRVLSIGWAIGFFVEGVLNLVVAYQFSEAFWVGYKLWGGLALTALFVILTVVYLMRGGYLDEAEAATGDGTGPVTGPENGPGAGTAGTGGSAGDARIGNRTGTDGSARDG